MESDFIGLRKTKNDENVMGGGGGVVVCVCKGVREEGGLYCVCVYLSGVCACGGGGGGGGGGGNSVHACTCACIPALPLPASLQSDHEKLT